MATEERINCPEGFGQKTRRGCKACSYCGYETCPVGGYFVFRPDSQYVYERYIVK